MKNNILKVYVSILGFLSICSCEKYLDAAPESNLEVEDVFQDFTNAQGFVEEMYPLVADYQTGGHAQTDWLYGDDGEINNAWMPSNIIDNGALEQLTNNRFTYINTVGRNNDPNDRSAFHRPGVWNGSLLGIRKANLMIENVDKMVNATQAEKDVVLGQAYFFRAFFHLEINKFWGRFPYIDRVLSDDFRLPRPETYKESALAAHEDFMRAAELLPVDWDAEPYGQRTLGENRGRVTKGAAYAYMGKNLLIAASPLMKGSQDTYDYDSELAAMAVDAFAEVFKLADQGRYALASFENYEEVFWDVPSGVWPGGTEFIFAGTGFRYDSTIQIMRLQMPREVVGGGQNTISPTHNLIHNNFGMSNGLSVQDDISGEFGPTLYDPARPFENRDPRFYKWITIDGDVFATRGPEEHRIAQLYTGGTHRGGTGSFTGYLFKKFYPTLNSLSNDLTRRHTPWSIRMRYTDIYLMFAEAQHAASGNATMKATSYNLSAEEAINVLRDRADVARVNPSIVADADKFMDEIRRERTVELSFETHRWLDIRRWVLAHLPLYKTKTGVDFPEKDENGEYAFFNEFTLKNRVCEYPKHFWIPFIVSETQIYEGFPQNPGW